MWWNRKQAPLAQPVAAAPPAELERRIETLERKLKHIEADAEEWITKYRTLYARTCKAAERVERQAAQEAPGATISPPEGVTPPHPTPDRWTRLRDANAAAARARGVAS